MLGLVKAATARTPASELDVSRHRRQQSSALARSDPRNENIKSPITSQLLADLGVGEGPVIVAGVVDELPLGGEMDDVGAHAVEEVLRMGHEDQDGGVLGEVLLQPDARLHVQVVRRLVQQQQRRLRCAVGG